MIKASALGRIDMVKELVDVAKVDPRHVDPYGVTSREKAELYLHHDVVDYLEKMEVSAKSGKFTPGDHSQFRRSYKLYSKWLDY